MNVFKMRDTLKSRLTHLEVQYQFNRDQESLRIYRTDNQKGVTVKLSPIVAKYNKGQKISLMKLFTMLKKQFIKCKMKPIRF